MSPQRKNIELDVAVVILIIILIAILMNRNKKLNENPISKNEEEDIIGTNCISNVIINQLFNMIQSSDDKFNSALNE